MDAKSFFRTVEQMRNAQRHFFELQKIKNKTTEQNKLYGKFLKEAIALEKIIDDEIERVNQVIKNRENESN